MLQRFLSKINIWCRKRLEASTPDSAADHSRGKPSSTPIGLSCGPEASRLPRHTLETDTKYGRVIYTDEGLAHKPLKDLKEICYNRKLPAVGKKSDIIRRIIASQKGQYVEGAAGP
jgi:hypothetical protein